MGVDVRETGLTIKGGQSLPSNELCRQSIISLEKAMEKEFGVQENTDDVAPVNSYHCKGNYAREIFISADTCIIGKIHKHEHINVISKGECIVVTEAGREILEAPLTFISMPGIKRAVYAITDTVWTTIHPTDETDMDKIEDEVIAKDFDSLDKYLGEGL